MMPTARPLSIGGFAHQSIYLLVVGVRAMAEVQSRDVHACVNETADRLSRIGRGPQGADDLRPATHVPSLERPQITKVAGRDYVRGRAVGGIGTGSRSTPVRNRSTAAAAARPSAIAHTISD